MSGGVCWLDRVKIGFGVRTEVLLWMHLTGRASSTKNVQNIPPRVQTPKMIMMMMTMTMTMIIIIPKLSVVIMVVVNQI